VSKEAFVAIIDDDEGFRTALVDSLSSLGYAARGFGSADEFVTEGGERLFNCVITDVNMPGMSGLDLKRLLVSRDSRVPVIMITAGVEPGLEARAAAVGAICLLRKPFETSVLIACLDKALMVQ
jgi:FixJ family two-component response regulator